MSSFASEADRFAAPESAAVRELDKVPSPAAAAFLRNIGHEIRTPLNGVLGLATLLRQTPLDPTQRMYVDAIEQSSEALLGVLSNLLEFAHLQAGTMEIRPAAVEIDSTARAALATIQGPADAKSIELKLELAEGAVSTRMGDRARIVQVLGHLLNNAVKFTQGGSVTLSIQRFGRDEDGLIRMTVTDTGIGMSPAQMDSILTGSEHHAGWEESPRGAGLGLLISQKLARQMGGRIVACSEPGRGSQFSLELPMGPNLAVEAPILEIGKLPFRGLHMLVVEDSSIEERVLSTQLTRLGASVTSLADGRRVAEALEGDRFAAVFLDLHLPALDAIRCTRAIRDLPEPAGEVPIIGVTAGLSELDRWACSQSGMSDFVMKPTKADRLVEAVRKSAGTLRDAAVRLSRPA